MARGTRVCRSEAIARTTRVQRGSTNQGCGNEMKGNNIKRRTGESGWAITRFVRHIRHWYVVGAAGRDIYWHKWETAERAPEGRGSFFSEKSCGTLRAPASEAVGRKFCPLNRDAADGQAVWFGWYRNFCFVGGHVRSKGRAPGHSGTRRSGTNPRAARERHSSKRRRSLTSFLAR